MIVCGLKLTHDGAVAVIEDGRLIFSVEAEKVGGGARYAPLSGTAQIREILEQEGLSSQDVDSWAIDGWHAGVEGSARITFADDEGNQNEFRVAPYMPTGANGLLQPDSYSGWPLGRTADYSSYPHVVGHIYAAYATSPFAEEGVAAFVLVWDGGMLPHLFRVEDDDGVLKQLGPLFPIVGNGFSDFSSYFGPFYEEHRAEDDESVLTRNLEVAGKAMAFAALGDPDAIGGATFDALFDQVAVGLDSSGEVARALRSLRSAGEVEFVDADAIASFQRYLGDKLVRALSNRLREAPGPVRLCIAGGCALNIKWNSQIRESGVADEVWIPPFPNDSGSAIGAAAAEWTRLGSRAAIEWDVFAGPRLVSDGRIESAHDMTPCTTEQLGAWLHNTGAPVVVLSGRAELGPRALGNRSILAAANDRGMTAQMNALKGRESFRPVAPIALEHKADQVFAPGSPDPFMLFEHEVNAAWSSRVAAVTHLDGTARLQTIRFDANTAAASILRAYEKVSGSPVLCNTSANKKGFGFFPSVASALEWGKLPVWSDNCLYWPNCLGRQWPPMSALKDLSGS